MRRLNLRENPFGDEGRWAIGDELLKKKNKWKKKQKEKKLYEGQDYTPPTQREKASVGKFTTAYQHLPPGRETTHHIVHDPDHDPDHTSTQRT